MDEIDFENEDFWKSAIQKSVAKRLIKRDHTYEKLLEDVCNLNEEDVKKLIELNKSCFKDYDLKLRENYLCYYRLNKYEDWECKMIIDLNEIELYEICEGKGQDYHFDFENSAESELIDKGERVAKNLALIEMTELGYSAKKIEKILGDCKTEYISTCITFIPKEATDKMENHFMNIGIAKKRYEIVLNFLKYENNIDNTSKITGLTKNEINKIINDNAIFKSANRNRIIDEDKIKKEITLANCELLIECLTIDRIYDDSINDFAELSGIDENYFKKIYEIQKKLKPELNNLLNQMAFKLMDRKFDYNDIEEITGLNMYDNATEDYFYNKYKECLRKEHWETIT